jgi:hypothetical protein
MLIENKYAAIAAALAFLLVAWLTGSLYLAFGGLALIAGIAWAVRKMSGGRRGRL